MNFKTSFPFSENIKMIFLMFLAVIGCILLWLIMSLIFGVTGGNSRSPLPEIGYTVFLGERLIGSH